MIKDDLACCAGADAELGFGLAASEARLVGFDHECRNAVVRLCRVGHGEQDDEVRIGRGRHPGLAAIDDVVRAGFVQHSATLHGAGIAAAHRFCQTIGPDLPTRCNGYEVFLLLILGAELKKPVGKQRVIDRHNRAMAGIGLADLDHRQHIGQRVHSCPAIFFRHFYAHEPQLTHLANRLNRELAGLIVLGGNRRDGIAGKVACRVPNHLVFTCNKVKHRNSSLAGGNVTSGRSACSPGIGASS